MASHFYSSLFFSGLFQVSSLKYVLSVLTSIATSTDNYARLFSKEDTTNLSCKFLSAISQAVMILNNSLCSVTYLNTSSFTFYLLPFLIRHIWRKQYDEDIDLQDIRCILSNTSSCQIFNIINRGTYETLPTSEHDNPEDPPLDVRLTICTLITFIYIDK